MIKIGNIDFNFEDTGYTTGSQNMKYDSGLVDTVKQSGKPIFRIYGWKPWTISLGANQKESQFDIKKLANDGYDIVRRPTGGRAVFHGNELTYCVVTNLNEVSHHQIYQDVHIFFEKVLAGLNIKTDFAKSNPKFNEFYKNELSASCFASSARYELTIDDKKVVGSAQRKIDGILLQHGSIPLDDSYLNVADYQIGIDSDRVKDYLKKISCHLSINESISYKILAAEIKKYDI